MKRISPIILEFQDREMALDELTYLQLRRKRRAAILLLASYGFPYRRIADVVGCDRDTVRRIIELFRQTGDTRYVLDSSGGGRPRKTSRATINAAIGSLASPGEKAGSTNIARSRVAQRLGVHGSTISRELGRDIERRRPSRQPRHLDWDKDKRMPFTGHVLSQWRKDPFINYPSAEELAEATKSITNSSKRKGSTWRKLRQLTSRSKDRQEPYSLATDEPALWQDMAIILAECWLAPRHPASQLWRRASGGDLAGSYFLLKEAELNARHENWQAIREYIDGDLQRIALALEIDPAELAGTAIHHWEKTYVDCFTSLATWLTDIGIAKSMEDMPKTTRKKRIRKKRIRSKTRQKAEEKAEEKARKRAEKKAIKQEFAIVVKAGAAERNLSETGAGGDRPTDPPPRPWCWDPFEEQRSPLPPPRIFREFMIRYGHLAET